MAFGFKMLITRYKLLSSGISNFISLRSSHSGGSVHQFIAGYSLNGKLKHKLKSCAQQERTAGSAPEASHLDSIDPDRLASHHGKKTLLVLLSLSDVEN